MDSQLTPSEDLITSPLLLTATKIEDDGWTAVTRDRSWSAQFEHTVGVTDTGVEIFTESARQMHQPPYNS